MGTDFAHHTSFAAVVHGKSSRENAPHLALVGCLDVNVVPGVVMVMECMECETTLYCHHENAVRGTNQTIGSNYLASSTYMDFWRDGDRRIVLVPMVVVCRCRGYAFLRSFYHTPSILQST